jgi:hypothetical protein
MDETLPCADTTLLYRPTKRESCVIHGAYKLPLGYEFAFVPSDAKVSSKVDAKVSSEVDAKKCLRPYSEIPPSSWDASKPPIAIFQTLSGTATRYSARGNQIDAYGYAAFGLTVVPYIFMSLLNLLAQISHVNMIAHISYILSRRKKQSIEVALLMDVLVPSLWRTGSSHAFPNIIGRKCASHEHCNTSTQEVSSQESDFDPRYHHDLRFYFE